MHDTCAPEASHRLNIKKAMDRVRKGSEDETNSSMIGWHFNTSTWGKITDYYVNDQPGVRPPNRRHMRTLTASLRVVTHHSRIVRPTGVVAARLWDTTCSPLSAGGDHLISNDVRVSYHELSELITSSMGWDHRHVRDVLRVTLYSSAHVIHPSGTKRTFWGTDTEYPYNKGKRRDMVEVDLGEGSRGLAQVVSCIEFTDLPDHGSTTSEAVLIRWLSKSSRSVNRNDYDQPLCDYPLSTNHCLWEWSDANRERQSFRIRGFWRSVTTRNLWSHVDPTDRPNAVESERRAYYDIIPYESLRCHANVSIDPSTGHMLQTLQIV